MTEPASSVTQTSATLNATVNPNGQTVSDCHFEYGTTTSYGVQRAVLLAARVGRKPGGGVRVGHGPHREHHLPLPDRRDQPERHELRLRPDVHDAAQPPDGRDRSGVVGHADLGDPERDGEPQRRGSQRMPASNTAPRTAYGSSAPCTSLPGSGTSPVAVSASVTGLSANTTYHFRISRPTRAARATAQTRRSKRCRTPPTVVTGAASSVTPDLGDPERDGEPQRRGQSANARSNTARRPPTGQARRARPSAGLGRTSPVAVSAAVTGLSANTTYHFRISATNAGGTSKGSDQTFKTLPNPPTVVTESGVVGHADLGDPERDGEPQRRGQSANASFEYGTTTAYGSSAPCTLARRGRAKARWRCPRRSRA